MQLFCVNLFAIDMLWDQFMKHLVSLSKIKVIQSTAFLQREQSK